jgi:hypothetical protein
MHTYKVFEVNEVRDDKSVFVRHDLRDTGKTVQLSGIVIGWNDYYARNDIINGRDIVDAIFKLYGFAAYAANYIIRSDSTNDCIKVYYNYIDGGYKDTWVLKRGV